MFERGLKNSFNENEVTLRFCSKQETKKNFIFCTKVSNLFFTQKYIVPFLVFGFFFLNVMSPNSNRNKKYKNQKKKSAENILAFNVSRLCSYTELFYWRSTKSCNLFSYIQTKITIFSLDKMLSFVKVRKNIFNFKEENEAKSLEIDRNGRERNGTIAKDG